jgi:hypothetical protein
MAVAFVRKTEGSTGSSDSTTLTLNIEVSAGSDRVLVVGLAYKDNNVLTPNSVVFNTSENFSVEHAGVDGGDAQCLLYYLVNPTVTTADVVITMASSERMVGFVAYFTGVHQSSPFTAETVQADGTDAAPTVDINSAADEICIDIMAQVSAGPDTLDSNSGTLICSGAATGGGTDTRGGGQYQVGQAVRSMTYGMSDSDNWNIIAGALQEPAGVTPVNFADTLALTSLTSGPKLFKLIDYVDTLALTSLTSDAAIIAQIAFADTLALTSLTSGPILFKQVDFVDTLSLTSLTSDADLHRLMSVFADTLALTSLTSEPDLSGLTIDFADTLALSSLTSGPKLFKQADFLDTLNLTSLTSDPQLSGLTIDFADTLALTSLTSGAILHLVKDFADTLALTSLTSDAKLYLMQFFADTLALTSLTSEPELSVGAIIDFADTLALTSLTSDAKLHLIKVFADTLALTSLTSDAKLHKVINFLDSLGITSLTNDTRLEIVLVYDEYVKMTQTVTGAKKSDQYVEMDHN